jgi:hypothetical protein
METGHRKHSKNSSSTLDHPIPPLLRCFHPCLFKLQILCRDFLQVLPFLSGQLCGIFRGDFNSVHGSILIAALSAVLLAVLLAVPLPASLVFLLIPSMVNVGLHSALDGGLSGAFDGNLDSTIVGIDELRP